MLRRDELKQRVVTACRVLSLEQVANEQYAAWFEQPTIAREATGGQFVEMRLPQRDTPLFSRPFSICDVDVYAGTFCVVFLVRGGFTQALSEMQCGQCVQVVGPLGNGFEATPNGLPVTLVAGGVGAPPMVLTAKQLITRGQPAQGIYALNGARSRDRLVCSEQLRRLGVHVLECTEDGSAGEPGLVTQPLTRLLTSGTHQVMACGPTPMLQAVCDACNAAGIDCQVSLETLMPCGVGVCLGCAVKVRTADGGSEYLRACQDGPVFRGSEVIWE